MIHFGCAHARASRRMRCLAARDPDDGPRTSRAANTLSHGSGVHGHTRNGADDESRTRGLDLGKVALCQLSYIRTCARTTNGQYRGGLASNCQRASPGIRWCDPSIAGFARGAKPVGLNKKKKARILAGSGPLRAEFRGCALTRCPHPDAHDLRSDQAFDNSTARPRALRVCIVRTPASRRHARTQPDHILVGCW